MKNDTPPGPGSAAPFALKITLLGGGILVMVMLILTARSMIGILRPASSSPDHRQTNAENAVVQQKTPAANPPSSAPDNAKPEASLASRPTPFAVEVEITRQREKARAETIAALQREAQEKAGTGGVPKEVLQQLEQSDPILY